MTTPSYFDQKNTLQTSWKNDNMPWINDGNNLMRDTSPHIEQKMHEMMRRKTPVERLMMGCSMYETSKHLVIRSILNDHPDMSQADLRAEFFLKFYGRDFEPEKRHKIVDYLKKAQTNFFTED